MRYVSLTLLLDEMEVDINYMSPDTKAIRIMCLLISLYLTTTDFIRSGGKRSKILNRLRLNSHFNYIILNDQFGFIKLFYSRSACRIINNIGMSLETRQVGTTTAFSDVAQTFYKI